MQTLVTSFRSDDFDFTQLARSGDVALFQKSKPKRTIPEYEVILIQSVPARIIASNPKPTLAHEAFPTPAQWGSKAWSFIDRQRAEVRFWFLVTFRQTFGPAIPPKLSIRELIGQA